MAKILRVLSTYLCLMVASIFVAHAAFGATETLWSLNYSGKPDLTSLYGWENFVSVSDAGVVANATLSLVSGRGTVTVAPPQAWCNDVITVLRGLSPKPKRIFIDWEATSQTNASEAQEWTTQGLAWLSCMRAAHTPGEFLWGFYGAVPINARFDATEQGPLGGQWAALESDNVYMEPLAMSVDFMTRIFYSPDPADKPGQQERYMRNQIMQARAMQVKLGIQKPIYCWTYQRYSQDETVHVPSILYEQVIRYAYQLCDGVLVWDWNSRVWATETALAWWSFLRPRATGPKWRAQ